MRFRGGTDRPDVGKVAEMGKKMLEKRQKHDIFVKYNILFQYGTISQTFGVSGEILPDSKDSFASYRGKTNRKDLFNKRIGKEIHLVCGNQFY